MAKVCVYVIKTHTMNTIKAILYQPQNCSTTDRDFVNSVRN